MSDPASPPPSRSRAPLFAALACLAVGMIAFLILREMDAPWSGKLGRTLYGVQEPGKLGYGEKYQRLIEVFTDVGDPVREKLKVRDWGSIGMRLSSTVVLVLALLGAGTARWWAPLLVGPAAGPGLEVPKMDRRAWLVLALLLVVGAAFRWPSARHYVTYDEQDNMRRNFHGFHDCRDPASAPKWIEAGFREAIWDNDRVNNPYLFSLLSELSQSVWRSVTGVSRERGDLVAMRFPSLLFGWLAIATTFWTARQLGLARLAPWAAGLMAVHALALHHSVEARGYGLNLCIISILPALVWRVLQNGNNRDWLAFGLVVFLAIFSYPGSLYQVALLNFLVAGILLWRWKKAGQPSARTGLFRWVAANSVAAILYLWIISPAVPQAMAEFHEKFPTGNLGFSWMLGATVTYATGLMPIYTKSLVGPDWIGPTHVEWFFTHFPRFPAIFVLCLLTLILFTLGLIWVWKQGKLRATILTLAAASGPIMVTHHYLTTGLSLYYWYIIYILPAVLILWAAGIGILGDKLGAAMKKNGTSVASILTAVIAIWMLAIGYQWPGSRQWDDGITYFSRQPPAGGWGAKSDPIRTMEIQRGSSLWVNTADGYLFCIRNFEQNPEAWNFLRQRPLDQWGKMPVPAGASESR